MNDSQKRYVVIVKTKKRKIAKIKRRLDETLYCEAYERASRPEKKKRQYIGITAEQSKPLMKGLV